MAEQDDVALIRLCGADEVAPGSAREVEVSGLPPLAVFRLEDGAVYVTDGICTHAYASLAEGFVDGDEIECPLHAGRFCIRDGRATEEPCEEPLKTYQAVEQDGAIFIRDPR